MPTDTLPPWLDARAIDNALSREKAPDSAELTDILDKSLALEPLSIQEAAALMRVCESEDLARLLAAADQVKQKVYGDRIVLSAPLHISNHCGSECVYCANRRGNTTVARKYMTPPEMREAGRKLIRQGHKRVILVSGQLPNADVEYLAEAVSVLYTVFDGLGEIRRINVSVGPLQPEEYAVLQSVDVGTVLIYQDTYHEQSYRAAHLSGPKSDYQTRLKAADTALQSGVTDTGLGLLLGLGPWQYDLLAVMLHAAHLTRVYDAGSRTVSMHRLRPAPGSSFAAPYPVSDGEYLRCVAIMRLAVPYTGIVLTTKEPAGLWRDGCNAGCSQLLTGSVANPYESWTEAPGEKVPFPIGEDCHLDEVVRFLLEEARHLPSFCTACPRLGRSGSEFLSMVQECGMKSQCGPNSIASFMEFLLNYATPYTRQLGEKLIAEKLDGLPEQERGAAERLLQKVRSGRMDEFI
ncbi:[FeFe] hydrogenase H-cluster radical SAM maturase HydG [Desulfovibrio sp. ZJ369]|uniref:[FeFe] hydrogenase H-cluster radical SAM maturase HydG n=1 Tax=Desulfovibrio sp. ZJ369 TaxID=2709793 RepID=UPI0013EAFEDA|nr:[FeFe] hydrogenase H-cluster radical SAM maturase HydG [Desulfovibrio sp. ZJ369]